MSIVAIVCLLSLTCKLQVFGFKHAPISWLGKNDKVYYHDIEFSGENDYSIVLLPDDITIAYQAVSALDEAT